MGALTWTLHNADCLTVLPTLPAESVNLIFADPPYNIGKAAWDKIPDYLDWCERWIAACSRVLKRNGAFWVSHSEPDVLVDIGRIIERHGRSRRNWITWWKHNGRTELGRGGLAGDDGLRSFFPNVEYLIYHADEGDWTAQSDQTRGFIFEPLRAYLAGERDRAGWKNPEINAAWCAFKGVASTSQTQKWFSQSCFNPPTLEAYEWLRSLFGAGYLTREHGDLRQEYECIQQEYEHLRYTFNNPGKVSSVWQFDPAPRNGHPTPKPEPLLERIILTCTNAGDMVLDPFAGSGTTLAVAERLGRESIGIEMDEGYCRLIERRLTAVQPNLFAAST